MEKGLQDVEITINTVKTQQLILLLSTTGFKKEENLLPFPGIKPRFFSSPARSSVAVPITLLQAIVPGVTDNNEILFCLCYVYKIVRSLWMTGSYKHFKILLFPASRSTHGHFEITT
jgi:hypothetical protein